MIKWTLNDKRWFLNKADELEDQGYEHVARMLREWISQQDGTSLA